MKVDSLDELKAAFAQWRRAKKHAREPIPAALLARARRTTKEHGVTAVVGVTRVEQARLFRGTTARAKAQGRARSKAAPRSVPSYSRLELSALSAPPAAGARPVAEVETKSGVTLRVFEPTGEMMGLLSAVCGLGGLR